jgi:hypothetical protein
LIKLKQTKVCNELCKSVYGFSREMELRQAKDQGIATMIELDGVITGYAAGIGIFGHTIAKLNEDLKALIANASAILGPDFFAPARNHELINWLLERLLYLILRSLIVLVLVWKRIG